MSTAPKNLAELFQRRVERSREQVAYRYPRGAGFASMTWGEAAERVRALAAGLLSLGLEREQRVAILSTTRLEWVLADLAVLSAGGATTTIYPSSLPEECVHILGDSESVFAFVEDTDQVEKLRGIRDQVPGVKQLILIEGDAGDDDWVISLSELERRGRKHAEEHPGALDEIIASVERDSLATLIYTSGTTGRSKGVELTHDCWLFEAESIDRIGILVPEDHQFLWLPLAHAFGKILEVAQLQIGFSTSIDGRVPKIVENLSKTEPTFMAAAPRIFEKVYNKVVTSAEEGSPLKRRIFVWAVDVGRRASELRERGQEPTGLLALEYKVADRLVFQKLRSLFGSRLRFLVSGSAPLSRDIARFFHGAGILILEGYGLTESSAASFINRPDNFRFGTVGLPFPGVEVRIAEDGEVLLHGRGIMRGYHKMPEATAEALTEDGWLRTGDIGELDEKGRLRITDRKKDLIKTSGGKYVAPAALEAKLKVLCPYLGQVVVHGNNRNFVTALVTLDEEAIKGWAKEHGLGDLSPAELAKHPKVNELVEDAVSRMNAQLASYETIKKFAILPSDFSVEEGTLTPSLKVKRKVVEDRYRGVLEDFYRGSLKEV